MLIWCILGAVGVLCASALGALLAWRSDRLALVIGTGGAGLACALGIGASVAALLRGERVSLHAEWPLPFGSIDVGLDNLSSFFLLCIFVVSGLSAVYGSGYASAYVGKKSLASLFGFFNLLVASMAGVVLARDAIVFLMAWEVMSLASFFLVTYESEREEVRTAGFIYLIASHLGVALLVTMFTLMARETGATSFESFARLGTEHSEIANAVFILALVGFGTKAGFWPSHVWLPEAHPAAPSHVSALMSGAMVKLGIYGLLRVIMFCAAPPAWWGAVLVGIGIVSGLGGVIHALAQHDIKRLLAYHTVENVGIITLGVGIGMLGQSQNAPMVACLGYSGALLHVLNHGLFKGLLFQGAGSILHAVGSRDIDSMGGLYRKMPITGLTFLVGAAAISGLPPLNGFVSEWQIYVAAFRGSAAFPNEWSICSAAAIPSLALIGGLASACFVKAFGIMFLGAPRSAAASHAHESGAAMTWPMLIGAALCVVIGVWPTGIMRLVGSAAATLAQSEVYPLDALCPFFAITQVAAALLALIVVLALLRSRLLRRRVVAHSSTW